MRDHEELRPVMRAKGEERRGESSVVSRGWVAGDGRIMIEGGACLTSADLSLVLTAGKV